jgi:acetyltransferase-like isoleucine patch superfamily enzyme
MKGILKPMLDLPLIPIRVAYRKILVKIAIELKYADKLRVEQANKVLLTKFSSAGRNVTLPSDVDIIGASYISIGDDFLAQKGLRLHCWKKEICNIENMMCVSSPFLQIGANNFMNRDCYISCAHSVLIGSNVLFGSNVFITDNYHGDTNLIDMNRFASFIKVAGSIVIEDGVWIGNNVCILPGSRIGKGSIIGANSIVNSFIAPYSVAAGSPAKIKRSLHT